jgi:MerR family transcriptional regulator, copper efflux regulator
MAAVPADNSACPLGLKIGQVSEYSGLPVKTIRFYCDQGLISPSKRSEGGYRLFDKSVYTELALIRTLRTMEVPLSELRRILEERRSGLYNCSALKGSIESKMAAIAQRIKDLREMRTEFRKLLDGRQEFGGRKQIKKVEIWSFVGKLPGGFSPYSCPLDSTRQALLTSGQCQCPCQGRRRRRMDDAVR